MHNTRFCCCGCGCINTAEPTAFSFLEPTALFGANSFFGANSLFKGQAKPKDTTTKKKLFIPFKPRSSAPATVPDQRNMEEIGCNIADSRLYHC